CAISRSSSAAKADSICAPTSAEPGTAWNFLGPVRSIAALALPLSASINMTEPSTDEATPSHFALPGYRIDLSVRLACVGAPARGRRRREAAELGAHAGKGDAGSGQHRDQKPGAHSREPALPGPLFPPVLRPA